MVIARLEAGVTVIERVFLPSKLEEKTLLLL
jgi:hypothetical protein